jgi:ferredoxin--NADP+ reductase
MTRLVTNNATIAERIDLTNALAIFRIVPDTLPKKQPWFTSGQYCVLGANNDDDPTLGGVSRAMSIASAPEAAGPVEFYIRRVARPESPNPLTHLLWKLKAGDRLHMGTTATGVFTIENTVGIANARLRVMVAAGTGAAPFISMIRSEVCRNADADLSRWVLLHGVSYRAELGYRDELLRLMLTNRLKYWGTVSRPGEADGWTGDVGRVDAFFDRGRLAEFETRVHLPRDGFVPRNVAVFICGPTGTIARTMTALIDRGFVPHAERVRRALGVPPEIEASVFYEQYDPQPVIDINDPTVIEPLRARMHAALANR